MDKATVILSLIIGVSLILILFSVVSILTPTGKLELTGNIILDVEENFNSGDKLNGVIILGINEQTNKNAPVLVSLIKGKEVLELETFSVGEIMQKSKQVNQEYVVEVKDLIDYTFEEKGVYELLFSALSLEINSETIFVVN